MSHVNELLLMAGGDWAWIWWNESGMIVE